ncbi:CD48 antigen-like [Melanotaenia boesemani]|uniref:CD48 antigen-like n=1 Tax=Melanotaenia boesemani TaxID=1250792 RepID=UPI001C04BC42|nr:CD48 antigen-like [Melanotaenia boesemani]
MKLKIIFFTGMILSAAEGQKNLTGVVGRSITLPDSMMERGFLSHNRTIVAFVSKNKFEIQEKIYTDKLYWDDKTGKFTIKNLQKNDSGLYVLDSKEGNVFRSDYRLMVYDAAPPPAVRRLNSPDGCLLECRVEEKTELSWYKDEQILKQSSSGPSLLLTVQEQDFSSSYRCVAANPAESKTLPVDVRTSCREENLREDTGGSSSGSWWFLVPMAVFGCVVVVCVFVTNMKRSKETERTSLSDLNSGPDSAETPA